MGTEVLVPPSWILALPSSNWKSSTLNVYYKRNMEKWRRPPNVWAFLAAPCTRRSRNIRLGRPKSRIAFWILDKIAKGQTVSLRGIGLF
jgi:hypothetical protein